MYCSLVRQLEAVVFGRSECASATCCCSLREDSQNLRPSGAESSSSSSCSTSSRFRIRHTFLKSRGPRGAYSSGLAWNLRNFFLAASYMSGLTSSIEKWMGSPFGGDCLTTWPCIRRTLAWLLRRLLKRWRLSGRSVRASCLASASLSTSRPPAPAFSTSICRARSSFRARSALFRRAARVTSSQNSGFSMNLSNLSRSSSSTTHLELTTFADWTRSHLNTNSSSPKQLASPTVSVLTDWAGRSGSVSSSSSSKLTCPRMRKQTERGFSPRRQMRSLRENCLSLKLLMKALRRFPMTLSTGKQLRISSLSSCASPSCSTDSASCSVSPSTASTASTATSFTFASPAGFPSPNRSPTPRNSSTCSSSAQSGWHLRNSSSEAYFWSSSSKPWQWLTGCVLNLGLRSLGRCSQRWREPLRRKQFLRDLCQFSSRSVTRGRWWRARCAAMRCLLRWTPDLQAMICSRSSLWSWCRCSFRTAIRIR